MLNTVENIDMDMLKSMGTQLLGNWGKTEHVKVQ